MKRKQCVSGCLGDNFADFKFAVKFHLAFGGMDVHVYGSGINFKEQAADRVAAFHQGVMITLNQRVVDAAIFHGPAVDENKLAVARRA